MRRQIGMGLSGGQHQPLCIARAIEDLIHELRSDYTIVILTHGIQRAARVSDETGFFDLEAAGQPGHLVELSSTQKMFADPDDEATEAHISARRLRYLRTPCRRAGAYDLQAVLRCSGSR